jgi:NitT/TauT family transport system permease protein
MQHAIDRALPALTFLAILLLWELCCRVFEIPGFLLPAPSAIAVAAADFPLSQWLGHLWATLQVTLLGFFISILVSLPIAAALTNFRFLSRTLLPILIVIQSTPIVAIAPIIVVTLGAGLMPRVVITCLITLFPLVIATATGLLATPAELIELSRSLRASRAREYFQIRLPFAVPYIFSALKVGITLSVIGAVIAEFVAAERGLGYLILFSTSSFKVPQAFAALAVLVSASLLLFRLIVILQQRLFPWSLPRGG